MHRLRQDSLGDNVTRDEVVKGLTTMLGVSCVTCAEENVVRAAIALLEPPTTEEIEAALDWLVNGPLDSPVGREVEVVLRRALAALAREPWLEAHVEKVEGQRDRLNDLSIKRMHEIAALEAKLARVREAAEHMPLHDARPIFAALADEATP